MRLFGPPLNPPPPGSPRTRMKVHPLVRTRIRSLLREPEMVGVGYTEFLERACRMAELELAAKRKIEWTDEPFDYTDDEEWDVEDDDA